MLVAKYVTDKINVTRIQSEYERKMSPMWDS
jgi:hypothetical protein